MAKSNACLANHCKLSRIKNSERIRIDRQSEANHDLTKHKNRIEGRDNEYQIQDRRKRYISIYGNGEFRILSQFLMSKLRSTDENRREKPVISGQNHRAGHRLKNSAEFRHKITRYYHFAFSDG
jgi:hypothetical protein